MNNNNSEKNKKEKFLKGEIINFNLEKEEVFAKFNLEDRSEIKKEELEIKFCVSDVELRKMKIEIENGKATPKGDCSIASIEDLEKEKYLLLAFRNKQGLVDFVKKGDLKMIDNLLIYK